MVDSIEEFKKALGADFVASSIERGGSLSVTEILATRSWFDRRRRLLTSTGGRRTNEGWTLKRQVPLAPDTWNRLQAFAETCSAAGSKVAPAQIAAFLLEDAVLSLSNPGFVTAAARQNREDAANDLDPWFKEWRQPELFCGTAA
jgi:hypothetical protein